MPLAWTWCVLVQIFLQHLLYTDALRTIHCLGGISYNETMSKATNLLRAPYDQRILLVDVASNPILVELLKDSTSAPAQARFEAELMLLIPHHFHAKLENSDLMRIFLSWCESPKLQCPPVLRAAARQRTLHKIHRRSEKLDFISAAGLNWSAEQRHQFLAGIRTIVVEPFSESYPPLGYWIYESEEIYDKWYHHLQFGKQKDKRIPRRPLHKLDLAKLAHDIYPDQSVIFRTPPGSLVGAVIRDFCPDQEALKWSDHVVKEAVDDRRNARVSTLLK